MQSACGFAEARLKTVKIVLIGPVYPYRGGIAHYTSLLSRAIEQEGHSLKLISFKRQYPRILFPGKTDKDPSAQKLEVGTVDFSIDSLNPISWAITFKHIVNFSPDVFVLQWWVSFWFPVWFFFGVLNYFVLKVPLVYMIHNVLPHEEKFWDKWLVQMTLRWGARFCVQSADERKILKSYFPKKTVKVIHHPIYDMFVDQSISKSRAREYLAFPPKATILLFFGVIREYKGLADFLNVFPSIIEAAPESILLIAGEFWQNKQKYLEMIENLGVTNNVIIADKYIPNEEVPYYFCAADVLVAPYRKITGSGVIQMAMGFQLPIISRQDIFAKDLPNTIRQKTFKTFSTTIAQNVKYNTWQDLVRFITTDN